MIKIPEKILALQGSKIEIMSSGFAYLVESKDKIGRNKE